MKTKLSKPAFNIFLIIFLLTFIISFMKLTNIYYDNYETNSSVTDINNNEANIVLPILKYSIEIPNFKYIVNDIIK